MPRSGPYADITVVDLSRVLAGPYCTMLLADLGARVIKVERPGTGDDARRFGPFVGDRSTYFESLNRGKESIALDLADDSDRSVFDRLLSVADVLVENFRPGAMGRLGYDWTNLSARFPRLIHAAISGFGQTGPYAHRPAYDVVVQAMGGVMSITGAQDGPPTRVGSSVGDIAAALFAASAIGAALHRRAATGVGAFIDVGMLDCQVAILENAIARYTTTGDVPQPIGSRHPSITPFGVFAVADDHIVIAAGNDGLFAKLCTAIGRPDLADDRRFATNRARTANHSKLERELESALTLCSGSHWLDALERACVSCGPINSVADILRDPQIAARNMVIKSTAPGLGSLTMAGNPIKFAGVDDPNTRPSAPALDEHRERILTWLDG